MLTLPKLLLLIALGIFSVSAAAQTGKVKVCRYPGLVELGDKETIPLVDGSHFTAMPDKNGSSASHIRLRIDGVAKLPPRPGCVVARASIDKNPDGESLLRSTKLRFNYSGSWKADEQRIPSLLVTVVEDFK